MTSPLDKTWEPSRVEAALYARWRERGYFAPRGGGEHFTVVLPPPNVTGRLHMGHALTATIEDTLVRWHRMRGHDALWLPGTDHAGIATQVMVERDLRSETGQSRHDIGREAFLARVWKWKEEHGGIIDAQHAALGASLDWSRYRFTMDEVSSRAVREAFVRLYEQGRIYRAFRLINWDSASRTALSDLEVEHTLEQGHLWHLAYPVEGGSEQLVVATTRPETMLGDTGVAVHPDDPRWRHLIGRRCVLPLTGRSVPIVGDAVLVDMAFGTGAVKVTPAHDFRDFETGRRHGLDLVQVIDLDGRICAPAPERFVGLDVATARTAVLAALEAEGALVRAEPHALSIGRSQRTGVVVEPLPSDQWFVDVSTMAQQAIAAVRDGRTTIVPEHRTADYFRWMENIHDWCISRQLWWGHRVPAWHCDACRGITVDRIDPDRCRHCGSTYIRQDEDVLDTWFSSGLWPLTTLGWPDEDGDMARFYPTALMETGWDILFFWVARMMMLGLHFTGDVPFRKVFLHSMVLGEDGQKMSKTKGNVVDPMELIDRYGADALRFYLATMAGQDAGIVFSRARVEGYRNFCTKLWNAARFALMNLDGHDAAAFRARVIEPSGWDALSSADRWIVARALEVARAVDEHLHAWRLDLAAHALYQFVWRELCDWYVELAKPALRSEADPAAREAAQGSLGLVLDVSLRLLHPIAPFVTEEIWGRLPRMPGDPESLMIAAYPRLAGEHMAGPFPAAPAFLAAPGTRRACDDVELLIGIVQKVRNLKAEMRVPPATRVDVLLAGDRAAIEDRLSRVGAAAAFVGRFSSLRALSSGEAVPAESASDVVGEVEVVLVLAGLVDLAQERARLAKEIRKHEGELAGLERKLADSGFLAKAPEAVVAKERARRDELAQALVRQRAIVDRLGG